MNDYCLFIAPVSNHSEKFSVRADFLLYVLNKAKVSMNTIRYRLVAIYSTAHLLRRGEEDEDEDEDEDEEERKMKTHTLCLDMQLETPVSLTDGSVWKVGL